MMLHTILLAYTSFASAAYVIQDDYEPSTFASKFDFFTGDDPTHGYVDYISQAEAESSGLYKVEDNSVYMGVDSTNVASGRGRDSVRISSKNTYNHGLFLLDMTHMPGGQCGTWPAFWLLGPNWPENGEVDIIEGANSRKTNSMALHTTSGCTITSRGQFTGQLHYSNCDISAPDQPYNTGCSINATSENSFGTGFNAIQGGIYATEWTSQHFAIWFFPRSSIPADITAGSPNPANWGLPLSEFSGDCDMDSKFKDQQILFDITFCGDWAGYDWGFDTTCNTKASSCTAFVQNNPSAFTETYWRINSLKVYQDNGSVPAPASTTTASSASSPSSSSIVMISNTTTTSTTSSTRIVSSSWTITSPANNTTSLSSTTSIMSTSSMPTITTSFFANTTTNTISTVSSISQSTEQSSQNIILTLTTLTISCPPKQTTRPSTTLRIPSIRTTSLPLNPPLKSTSTGKSMTTSQNSSPTPNSGPSPSLSTSTSMSMNSTTTTMMMILKRQDNAPPRRRRRQQRRRKICLPHMI